MKRYTRRFTNGQAYIRIRKLRISPRGSEVCGEPIQQFALYESSELEPAQVLLMKMEMEKYRLLGTPESIAEKLKATGYQRELLRIEQQSICTVLPDGTVVKASPNGDLLHPGISISIVHDGGEDERLCFVELNPDKDSGRRLCIGAYRSSDGADDASTYFQYYVEDVQR